MLKTDPQDRVVLQTALEHPWIKSRDFLKAYVGRNKKEQSITFQENQASEESFLFELGSQEQ